MLGSYTRLVVDTSQHRYSVHGINKGGGEEWGMENGSEEGEGDWAASGLRIPWAPGTTSNILVQAMGATREGYCGSRSCGISERPRASTQTPFRLTTHYSSLYSSIPPSPLLLFFFPTYSAKKKKITEKKRNNKKTTS